MVATFIADLLSQASVRTLAAEVLARYPKLDVLVNNAGAMYGTRQLTKDGIELTWAVNHLAPFLLSKLLLQRLKESAPARIITTASQAHQGAHIPFDDLNAERSYRGFCRYCETRLANILFTTERARRLDGTGVTANCFHPGLVATGFNRNNGLLMNLGMTILRPVARSPKKGAETLVWLATSPDVANVSGVYFLDQEQRSPSPEALDTETAERLWEISERQCAVSGEVVLLSPAGSSFDQFRNYQHRGEVFREAVNGLEKSVAQSENFSGNSGEGTNRRQLTGRQIAG